MKVLKIIGSLDFGGIEKVFEIVARYHTGNKADIVFLALGKGGATQRSIVELGYRVVVWDKPTSIPSIALIGQLIGFIRRENPDVVHTTGAEANFHGIIAAWLCQVPVRVAEEIGMPAHSPSAKWVFKQVYKLASKVIAVAGQVQRFLVDAGEARPQKVSLIYNPVDIDAFYGRQRKADKEPYVILSVCRLDPVKNLETMLRAFAQLQTMTGRKLAYWIVGDGPSRGALEGLAASLGLGQSVTFWGFQQVPAAFMEKASLFVLPSLSEGLPVSVVEAMLAGLPCVVTKVGGAPEFIDHGDNGWLIDPNDQEGLIQLIHQIIHTDDQDINVIARKGTHSVLEQFHPNRYLELTGKLYQDCQPQRKQV